MTPRTPTLAALLALALAACSSSGDDDGGGDDDPGDADAGGEPGVDADVDGFVELIGRDVEIAPGTEPYRCVTLTLAEDTYVRALKDLSPLGTHHTVLSVGAADGPDRSYDCDVGDNEMQMLFASGVGSDVFAFPDGVALKVEAGQQLKLNIHLYNAGAEPLTGHVGVLVETVPADEVADVELAEMIFAGDYALSIQNTGEPETEQGSCEMKAGTLINLWPHMHKLGRHIEVTLAGRPLLDEAFDFLEQRNWPMEVPLTAGDDMVVTCTYVNDTDVAEVGWGESSDQEMCFVGFYRYPATGAGMFCLF